MRRRQRGQLVRLAFDEKALGESFLQTTHALELVLPHGCILPAVKSALAFLAINVFFVAVNALGAAVLFGFFRLGQAISPQLMEEPAVVIPLGLLGIGATLACAAKAMSVIDRRLARGPARARG